MPSPAGRLGCVLLLLPQFPREAYIKALTQSKVGIVAPVCLFLQKSPSTYSYPGPLDTCLMAMNDTPAPGPARPGGIGV